MIRKLIAVTCPVKRPVRREKVAAFVQVVQARCRQTAMRSTVAIGAVCMLGLVGGCGGKTATNVSPAEFTDSTLVTQASASSDVVANLGDLPSGWMVQPSSGQEAFVATAGSLCDGAGVDDKKAVEINGGDTATATFSSIQGAFLSTTVMHQSDAREIMRSLPAAFAACDGTTGQDGYLLHVAEVAMPSRGDESLAMRLEYDGPLRVSVIVAYSRVNDSLLVAATTTIGPDVDGVDVELVDSAITAMASRL